MKTLKRHRAPISEQNHNTKTKLQKKDKDVAEVPEQVVEEQEEEADAVGCSDSNVYDVLLKKLGSRNSSAANVILRKHREEGIRGTDEDSESGSESSDEEDDDSDVEGTAQQTEAAPTDTDEDDEDDSLFDSEESDIEVKNIPSSGTLTSTFDKHLNYKLEQSEIEKILERKWKYTWKRPALDMSNCHWRGTGACFIDDVDMNFVCGLKPRLYKHWLKKYQASGGSEFEQSKQRSFFTLCNSYYDILHHKKKPFYLKGQEEDSSVVDAYLMHSLNHIFKSRDLVVKNERNIAKLEKSNGEPDLDDVTYLDRGFTRPKVLILLPIASIARRVVKRLIRLTPSDNESGQAKVENLERFYDEFGTGRTEDDDDDDEISKSKKSSKPSDHQALLGDNDNDHFMIGVKFTHRCIKLYGDFYTSDLIVASPLGLITKINEAELEKEKDVDYLSSIEILIIDHADVMLMQNWSHVSTVVEQLNSGLSKRPGTNIMRIRPWYLNGQARFYRQSIFLSSHISPDINALFNHHCLNYQGKIKLDCTYKGVLPKVLIQAKQVYERFETKSIAEADDARLKYFCDKVFPKIKDSVQDGIMIFISSYFEFVRIRNFLKSQGASFCLFGEYIKRNEISRVRGEFYRGEKKIMLYTERAHFYYRYKIRGVKNLIIYSLPERKEFYPEIVNLLQESDGMKCTVLFSTLDNLRLERIVGSTAARRMINSEKGVFVFA